jgi:hypothetical protein
MSEQPKITVTWAPLSDFLKRNPAYSVKSVAGSVVLVKK